MSIDIVLAPSGVHILETDKPNIVIEPDRILVEMNGIIKMFSDLSIKELIQLKHETK